MSQRFNLEDRNRALHVLALCAGNSYKAARELAPEGIDIDHSTLRWWRNSVHVEEYERIRRELEERIDTELAEEMLSITQERLRLMVKTGEKYEAALDTGDTNAAKDLAGADRNLGVNVGITTTHNRMIREKPTHFLTQHVSTSELASELARLNPAMAKALGVLVEVENDVHVVDGEAKEIES